MDKNKIQQYYSNDIEKERLELDIFKLEAIRTREIIGRYLIKDNMRIADIGGGAGYYAFWLQKMGHQVSLIDLSERNIELVNEYSKKSGVRLTKAEAGDATNLKFEDGQFDLVLLLGPLYHLTDKKERIKALSEVKRILKPGGCVLAAIISRYASLFDGFKRDLIYDDAFENIMVDDLKTGIHKNGTRNLEYFTTAYFHTPSEIKNEIGESGLHFEQLLAIESFGWVIDNFKAKSEDSNYMNRLLKILNMVETSGDIMAMSPHIMAIARK